MSESVLNVAVYGLINAGKSSLINALSGAHHREAGPIGGTSVDVSSIEWRSVGDQGYVVHLIDTPGLEEVGDEARGAMATDAARSADLVLFVMAEDLTATARRALLALRKVGKPIVVAVNKVDLLDESERAAILDSIRSALDGVIPPEDIVATAAAPIVRRRVEGDSRVETVRGEPDVSELESRLISELAASAGDLKELARASATVEQHIVSREHERSTLRDRAIRVADESGVALALAMAVNPVPLVDFLTGPGGLAILVHRVSSVYGEPLSGETARAMARELIRGGRVVLWGSLAATVVGGAFKLVPGLGHLAGALTQGASAGYFAHVVGRALVDYLENGKDWGDGGIVAALDRVAASTDRRALTRGLVDQIKARLKGKR